MQKTSQFFRSKVRPLFLHWTGPIALLFFILVGCDQFYNVKQDVVVARAGNSYLYRSELRDNITVFSSKTDSIIQFENYINNWARKQLLYDQALINLAVDAQKEMDELVNSYRSDLWSRSYKEFIVNFIKHIMKNS